MSTPTVTRNAEAPPQSGSELKPLVTPPEPTRRLPAHPAGEDATVDHQMPAVWLLGAHGGAGVSSLIRAGAGGRDAQREWPPAGLVLVVARRTAYGLEWARDAARQHAAQGVPAGLQLAGLAVVADAPGRTPPRLARFLDLIGAAYPRVWEIPWVEEWRLAGYMEPLPSPPSVRQLDNDLQALLGACTAQEKE